MRGFLEVIEIHVVTVWTLHGTIFETIMIELDDKTILSLELEGITYR